MPGWVSGRWGLACGCVAQCLESKDTGGEEWKRLWSRDGEVKLHQPGKTIQKTKLES